MKFIIFYVKYILTFCRIVKFIEIKVWQLTYSVGCLLGHVTMVNHMTLRDLTIQVTKAVPQKILVRKHIIC